MKKFLLSIAHLLLILLIAQISFAYTINDNYYGANDHGWGDVIGNSAYFDINRMEVSFNNGYLIVDVYSSYFDNIGIYETQLGDLFISNNGWAPHVTSPYLSDNASNGESWEYALVLNNHSGSATSGTLKLCTIGSGTIKTSFAPPGYTFRDGQEVQFTPTGSFLATGTWAINNLVEGSPDTDDYLRFNITYGNWGVIDSFGFHWGMTCANDVIEGAAPVPEPSTLLLLGAGLIGLGLLGRRKMVKKIVFLLVSISFLLLPISAGATPQLGVIDTDLLAMASGTVPVGMDGFLFPSDGRITVWWGSESGSVNSSAHVWILTTQGSSNTFTVGGNTIYNLNVPVNGQVDGYPMPYWGADLGNIGTLDNPNSPWVKATFTTAPDLITGSGSFFLINGVFGGTVTTDNWIFAIADIDPTDTTSGLLVFNNGRDQFSPKTTSTVVPEPSTLLLLGFGLVGIGLLGRKKFRTKH